MKKVLVWSLVLAMMAFAFIACEEDEPTETEAPLTAQAIYVLNSAATSISQIDLETGDVYNNVATVGTWPNQLVYKNGKVYCVNSGSNNIMIFDADSWDAETPINLGDGNNPMNMVFYTDDIAFVACSVSEKVLKVNVSTKTVMSTIDADVGCTGILITNGKVYTANTAFNGTDYTYGQGTVTVIDPDAGTVSSTINVATNPQALAVASDGMIHVVSTGDYFSSFGTISVIDPSTDAVTETYDIGGSPGSIALDTDNHFGYLGVWGSGAIVYNTTTGDTIYGPGAPLYGLGGSGLLVDPEGYLFLSVWSADQVAEIASDGTVANVYDVGDSPSALAIKTGR